MRQLYQIPLLLTDESHRVSEWADMRYKNALEKDLTGKLNGELKLRGKSKQNIILSWFGVPRDGKSYSLIRMAEKISQYWGIKLKIENLAFTPSQALEIVQKCGEGEIVILDEQIKTYGTGSGTEATILSTIEKNVGKKRIIFLFASPDIRSHEHRFYFEAWGPYSEHPFDPEKTLEEQWSHTKFIVYNNKNQQIGYIFTDTPHDKKFLEVYEKRKDEHIEKMTQLKGSERYRIIGKTAEHLLDKPGFLEKFAGAESKRVKSTLTKENLEGFMMSSEEHKDLIDFLEAKLATEERFQEQVMKIEMEKAVKRAQIKEQIKSAVKSAKKLIKTKNKA